MNEESVAGAMAPGRLVTLACLFLLVAPSVLAQNPDVTADVQVFAGDAPATEAEPGQLLALVADVEVPQDANPSWRAFLNGSVGDDVIGPVQQSSGEGGSFNLTARFNAPFDAEDNVTVRYTLTVQSLTQPPPQTGNDTANGTDNGTAPPTWQDEGVFQGTIVLGIPAPPPPPGPPFGLIAAVVALVLVAAAAVVVARRRPRQVQAEPKSRALQELKAEDAAEKARKKGRGPGPEAVVTQEPRVHPQVKILEARAGDVRRLIELAKERHERGELTEHQFKNIRDKKEAELQRIHEEIDGLRGGE